MDTCRASKVGLTFKIEPTVGRLAGRLRRSSGLVLMIVAGALWLALANVAAGESQLAGKLTDTNQMKQQKAALEAELNSIVQRHSATGDNKLLAEAIISRLMDNLTGQSSGPQAGEAGELEHELYIGSAEALPEDLIEEAEQLDSAAAAPFMQAAGSDEGPASAADSLRLNKLLSLLQSYELGNGRSMGLFPVLPSSQAATMKRAALKMGSYLQQQQQQRLNGYGRNSFDFGLGKRPDSGSASILRLGDSIGANGGASIQPVGQFGKRPSAHRYDFGLGKRVASVS